MEYAHAACQVNPFALIAQDEAKARVTRSLDKEMAERKVAQHLFYVSRERSSRTGGHLWLENVVETEGGEIRRLISIDGTPLSPERSREEDARITKLAAQRDRKRRPAATNDKDSGDDLIRAMERAFTFTFDGRLEQCTRVRFKADPAFKPDSYKECVLHALEGTILIKEPDDRVCAIDGRISHPVEFGFGVIGKVEEGGIVRVARNATASGKWQVSTLKVQIKGRIVLKGISQDDEESRSDFGDLSPHLTLSQAASLTRSIPHAGGQSQVSDPSVHRAIAAFSTEAMPEK